MLVNYNMHTYRQFVKKYFKEHKGAKLADVAKAWNASPAGKTTRGRSRSASRKAKKARGRSRSASRKGKVGRPKGTTKKDNCRTRKAHGKKSCPAGKVCDAKTKRCRAPKARGRSRSRSASRK